jgi:flagellar biosynthetic protein FliR
MHTINLETFLSGHVWGFLFVFSRVGSIMMLMPGIGERYVPARMRLMLALSITLLMVGPLLPRLPPPPTAISDFVRLLGYEIIIGFFYGTLLRILVGTLEAAGTVIALQSGLSNAQILNPALASQSTLPSALLDVIGITMIFITGLDHVLLRSLARLYDVFPAGGTLMTGDMAQTMIMLTSKSFNVGIEMALPFFVIGLLFYTVMGIMQKLLPNVQLFLVAIPAQIWLGLTLFAITISGMIVFWLHYFDTSLASILGE